MQVFISYTQADRNLAQQLAEAHREMGFQVWDDSEILPGDNWALKLGEALQQSTAMVVLLTPAAVQSPHVRSDLEYALGRMAYKGRLVPVLAAPPGQLPHEGIPWVLTRLQMINLAEMGRAEGFRKIAEALRQAA